MFTIINKKIILLISLFLIIGLISIPSAEAGLVGDIYDWVLDLFGWGEEDISNIDSVKFTPSTMEICKIEQGKRTCTITIYSGIRFIFEDEEWKPREEARSFIGSEINCKVISDGINIAKCLEWNDTSRTIEFERKDNAIEVPLRKYTNELDSKTDELIKVYDNEFTTDLSFSITPKTTQIIKANTGDIIEFGEHSTTIGLDENNGGLTDDIRVLNENWAWMNRSQGTSPGLTVQHGTTTSTDYVVFLKFDTTIVPVSSIINNATLWLYRGSGTNFTSYIYHVYDQSWVEGVGGDATVYYPQITYASQPCINISLLEQGVFDGIPTNSTSCNLTMESSSNLNQTGWAHWQVKNSIQRDND